MSSLSFTLIYHFTGLVLFSVCPAEANTYRCHPCSALLQQQVLFLCVRPGTHLVEWS